MQDETGTSFCPPCAVNAAESGLFRGEESDDSDDSEPLIETVYAILSEYRRSGKRPTLRRWDACPIRMLLDIRDLHPNISSKYGWNYRIAAKWLDMPLTTIVGIGVGADGFSCHEAARVFVSLGGEVLPDTFAALTEAWEAGRRIVETVNSWYPKEGA
jgi:hypothetical protein